MGNLITAELLGRLCPHARAEYVDALCGSTGQRLLATHGITTHLRAAHFLAQICHETGGLAILWESGNYSAERLLAVFPRHFTAAQARVYAHRPEAILNRAYANRMGNGPEASGDGWRHRGVNLLQSTGADSRRKYSGVAGVDLIARPEMAADAGIGLKMALAEWSVHDLNKWADQGFGRAPVLAISRAINCGSARTTIVPNGFAGREAWLHKWTLVLGAAAPASVGPPPEDELHEGERGAAVLALQRRLAALGYAVGACDGVFGGRTRAAVAAFQDREQLGGSPGVWLAGYDQAPASANPLAPPAQALASPEEARAAVPAGALGWLRGLAAMLGLGGVIDGGTSLPDMLAAVRRVVEPFAGNLTWLAHCRPALIVAGAVVLLAIAARAERAHVQAYRTTDGGGADAHNMDAVGAVDPARRVDG